MRGPPNTHAYSTRPAPTGSTRQDQGRSPLPLGPLRGSSESGDRYDYDNIRSSASRKRVEKAASYLSPAVVADSSAMRQASGAKRTSGLDCKQGVKDREKLKDN
jgi:hypothetical protein